MISRFTFLCLLLIAVSANSGAQYIYTYAGTGFGASTGTGGYTGDGGLAKHARLNSPTGVAYDGIGNIYIADRANNVVRKVAVTGIITTFAGKDTAGYSGDLGPATAAKLNKPYSVAADVYGNVYISDEGNNVIRKVNAGGTISTYAGTGMAGYSGDMGPATAAMLNGPQGIATDTLGNLYIADADNHAVRKVWLGGTIETIAGNGTIGYSGDGGSAVNAKLYSPVAVAVDPLGQVYIADYFNNAVRKINGSGIITTFAGTGPAGYSGDGGAANAAKLRNPAGVAVFGFGPVYIADQGNNVIRVVNSAGTINHYAGMYTNGYAGDGGTAATALLSSPKGIAVNSLNKLYVADYDNNVIRVIGANNSVNTLVMAGALKVYPNPATDAMAIEMPEINGKAELSVTDMLGRSVGSQTIDNAAPKIILRGLASGSYIIRVIAGEKVYRAQVEVR
ncbi:MAG: hypothetical protein K0Q79_1046 [Flavipsychrobacter sp.]|jgi:hypothetical protein|nr:hypothetical protein [Flavipsychrobacter sp.]